MFIFKTHYLSKLYLNLSIKNYRTVISFIIFEKLINKYQSYKIYLLLLLAIGFALQSCDTNHIEEWNNTAIDYKKIESLKTMDESTQRIAFSLLNNPEKAELWLNQMGEILVNKNVNSLQTQAIKD